MLLILGILIYISVTGGFLLSHSLVSMGLVLIYCFLYLNFVCSIFTVGINVLLSFKSSDSQGRKQISKEIVVLCTLAMIRRKSLLKKI